MKRKTAGAYSGRHENFWRVLFWLYLLAIFLVICVKFNGSFHALKRQMEFYREYSGGKNYNLQLFKNIRYYGRNTHHWWGWINIFGNLVPFMPYPVLLQKGYVSMRGFFPVMISAFFMIFAIEIIQLVTYLGYFDVDDIILNMAGVFAGYLIWLALPGKWRRGQK